METESVESSGPPPVITNGSSNSCMNPAEVMTARKRIVGLSSGSVMRRKIAHGVAPSTFAASYRTGLIPWSAARKTTMSNPKLRHTPSAMIDASAVDFWPSQFGPSMPTTSSAALTRPKSGLSRYRQITAIATMLVTTGR